MEVPTNRTTVFYEIAESVMGVVTRSSLTQFDGKTVSEKTDIVARTMAAVISGGFLGCMLTPSPTISSLLTGILAFSHFSHIDKGVVPQRFSLFYELAETPKNIFYKKAFKRFRKIPTTHEQAWTVAKVIGVAIAIGIVGSVIGFSALSLFIAGLPFTFAHFTRPSKEVVLPLASEESVPAAAEQSTSVGGVMTDPDVFFDPEETPEQNYTTS